MTPRPTSQDQRPGRKITRPTESKRATSRVINLGVHRDLFIQSHQMPRDYFSPYAPRR